MTNRPQSRRNSRGSGRLARPPALKPDEAAADTHTPDATPNRAPYNRTRPRRRVIPHRVFISHSIADTWVAKQISEHIRSNGAETFLDENDIQHGDDFEDEILKAEESCSELLVLLTPWSITRSWIWLEIGFFRRGKKRIVGVLHGITVNEITKDERVASVLKRLDMVNINDLDSYFTQLNIRCRSP
jgi:hypothetical protein